MTVKVIAAVVAIFAVSVFYVHEYHRDDIASLSKIPILKQSFSILHNFMIHISHKLSPSQAHSDSSSESEKLYTVEEISKYRGEKDSLGLYLSILGKVYDVSKGNKHYGPDGSYHAFAGRDASRAFVTGDFSEGGLTDDVMGLTPEDIKSIQDWSQFYHKEYVYKGKLIGRFYNSQGKRTDYYKKVDELIKVALEDSAAKNADYQKYPPCNVEWTQETGSKVWCSTQSGGIERDWAGVPRKYYKPGSDSSRCACIKLTEDMKQSSHIQRRGNLEDYEGCSPDAVACYVRD